MDYPLELTFKLLAIAQQITVTDARGQLAFYVKQKAFKLKEAVTVFADQTQQHPVYTINANKVLDFSARYNFADSSGRALGSVRRRGMRSIWKAHYEIYDDREQLQMTIKEENAWTKVLDALVGEIPVVGMFTGYMFHPAYLVTRTNGANVMRLEKRPAFFQGKFLITKNGELPPEEETRAVLSLLMMVLLERRRG